MKAVEGEEYGSRKPQRGKPRLKVFCWKESEGSPGGIRLKIVDCVGFVGSARYRVERSAAIWRNEGGTTEVALSSFSG